MLFAHKNDNSVLSDCMMIKSKQKESQPWHGKGFLSPFHQKCWWWKLEGQNTNVFDKLLESLGLSQDSYESLLHLVSWSLTSTIVCLKTTLQAQESTSSIPALIHYKSIHLLRLLIVNSFTKSSRNNEEVKGRCQLLSWSARHDQSCLQEDQNNNIVIGCPERKWLPFLSLKITSREHPILQEICCVICKSGRVCRKSVCRDRKKTPDAWIAIIESWDASTVGMTRLPRLFVVSLLLIPLLKSDFVKNWEDFLVMRVYTDLRENHSVCSSWFSSSLSLCMIVVKFLAEKSSSLDSRVHDAWDFHETCNHHESFDSRITLFSFSTKNPLQETQSWLPQSWPTWILENTSWLSSYALYSRCSCLSGSGASGSRSRNARVMPLDSSVFAVKKVNLAIQENSVDHRTSEYYANGSTRDHCLILRRGFPFKMQILFSRDYVEKTDVINFVFTVAGKYTA